MAHRRSLIIQGRPLQGGACERKAAGFDDVQTSPETGRDPYRRTEILGNVRLIEGETHLKPDQRMRGRTDAATSREPVLGRFVLEKALANGESGLPGRQGVEERQLAEAVGEAHAEDPHEGDATRRDFIFIAAGAVGVAGAVMAAWPFIDSMNPASDTLALSSTEYDLSQVPLGQQVVIMWRGLPVFVRHRTPQEIAHAVADDRNPGLKDPATDASRVAQADGSPGKAEWLILQANCTHLGCVPTFGGGEFGGWQCACHGSVYDTAGRIRHGPAPKNLFLAPHTFTSDTVVKIG